MTINDVEVWITLPGRFNASNLLSVYAASILLGQHPDDVIPAVSRLSPVPGRFETFRSESGTTGIVDYAHTPDALKHVLDTIREVNVSGGEIITVVGAGVLNLKKRLRSSSERCIRHAELLHHLLELIQIKTLLEDLRRLMGFSMTCLFHN